MLKNKTWIEIFSVDTELDPISRYKRVSISKNILTRRFLLQLSISKELSQLYFFFSSPRPPWNAYVCVGQVYIFLSAISPNGEWRQNIGGRELRRENFVQIFAQRSWSAYTRKHIGHIYIHTHVCWSKNNSRDALPECARCFHAFPYSVYTINEPILLENLPRIEISPSTILTCYRRITNIDGINIRV